MVFELTRIKACQTSVKHDIDFNDARKLWDDPDLIEIPARTEDEPRFLVVGMIDKQYWSAVITYRDEHIRIISVGRSHNKEIQVYES
jgi:hypothetical protein